MPATLHELGIDKWSLDDRLELAHQLWDSIATGAGETGLPESVAAELDRRVAELDANPDGVESWAQVKEYVRRKR
jgi:putative addiction module component (TIGR02574 family)